MEELHLHLAVLIGTVRQGRRSGDVARWLDSKISTMEGVTSSLIDLRDIDMPLDDAGRGVADPRFAKAIDHADGLILVVPEYNGSYPGLLKHAMDTLMDEYLHKAVGLSTVAAGGLGGARLTPTLLPVLRDFGLVAIRHDLPISNVRDAFDESGSIRDEQVERRAERFLDEMVWMTRVLRAGREKSEG